MPLFGVTVPSYAPEEPRAMMRRGVRWALIGIGLVIMAVGIPLALLPWLHIPGALILAIGLVLVLRNSVSARRTFIRAQRRHPKIVFPIRRLLRREPEVFPVAWQASLRLERMITPWGLRRLRLLRRARRTIKRRRR